MSALVTGRGDYANRSIFLPAAGRGNDSGLSYPGSTGHYWSSAPTSDNSQDAWSIYYFSSIYFYRYRYDDRYLGQSVRPVRGFAE